MSKLMENVAIANSAMRTFLALILVGTIGLGGFYVYSAITERDRASEKARMDLIATRSQLAQKETQVQEQQVQIRNLRSEVAEQQQEIERLDTALRLLKIDHRVARLDILDQSPDPETGKLVSVVEFQELDENGGPIDAPRQFRIAGDLVYIDAWVVKFDDKYIEEADIDRATSLVLFRRIFGEDQKPVDGFVLDEAGARPSVYGRSGQISELERKIWSDFWSVANDEGKQLDLGIRAAHGEAPSVKVQKGKSYRLDLRSSGGLSIAPAGDAPMRAKPAA